MSTNNVCFLAEFTLIHLMSGAMTLMTIWDNICYFCSKVCLVVTYWNCPSNFSVYTTR